MAQIVRQPQAARFITGKLWNFFAGQPPSDELNNALAALFSRERRCFKPFLRVMFRSEEFYEPPSSATRSKARCNGWSARRGCSNAICRRASSARPSLRTLGQDLFAPPNVKGWDGGITWITTNTLLERYNDAATLVQGTTQQLSAADFARKPGGPGGMVQERRPRNAFTSAAWTWKKSLPGERADKDKLVASLQHRLLQSTTLERTGQSAERFSGFPRRLERGGHPQCHPLGHVHTRISSHMKMIIRPPRRPRSRNRIPRFFEDENERRTRTIQNYEK